MGNDTNDLSDRKNKAALSAVADARELGLLRAFARHHGVTGLPEVPSTKTREASETARAAIVAARAKFKADADWLLLGRDAACVEFGLTPDQVTGILSRATRLENRAATQVLAPRQTDWLSPANWPPRIAVQNGGQATEPPARGHVERQADEDDKRAVIAARAQAADDASWDAFRRAYGAHRRLTTQQIAKIVADSTRAAQQEAQA